MDISTLATIVGQIGALGVSLFVLIALLREWLVPKGRLDDMRRERDAEAKRVDELVAGLEHLADVFRARR